MHGKTWRPRSPHSLPIQVSPGRHEEGLQRSPWVPSRHTAPASKARPFWGDSVSFRGWDVQPFCAFENYRYEKQTTVILWQIVSFSTQIRALKPREGINGSTEQGWQDAVSHLNFLLITGTDKSLMCLRFGWGFPSPFSLRFLRLAPSFFVFLPMYHFCLRSLMVYK